jgi:hypothetical protein
MQDSSSNQQRSRHYQRYFAGRHPMTPWHKQRFKQASRDYQAYVKTMKKESKSK